MLHPQSMVLSYLLVVLVRWTQSGIRSRRVLVISWFVYREASGL